MIEFSEAYIGQLAGHYPGHEPLVDYATSPDGLRAADLPHQPGESLQYVRLGQDGAERPLMYVAGMTEGLVSKLPIAVDLAARGFDVAMADQNRSATRLDVTTAQARNNLALMEAEGLQHGGLDFVGKSYGSLVLGRMAELEPAAFDDSRIMLMASSGLNREWLNLPGMAYRFYRYQKTEGPSKHDIQDIDGSMYRAGLGLLLANKWRSLREAGHLATRQVDHERLLAVSGGRLAVATFADDEMYPQRVQQRRMEAVVAAGGRWLMPVQFVETADGLQRDTGATHNDEQFNPRRVGGAIEQLLRHDPSFAAGGDALHQAG